MYAYTATHADVLVYYRILSLFVFYYAFFARPILRTYLNAKIITFFWFTQFKVDDGYSDQKESPYKILSKESLNLFKNYVYVSIEKGTRHTC